MAYMSSTESRVFSRCGPRLQLEPSKPLRTTPAGPTTNATTVAFTVTFNTSVTGVDLSDFAVAATGTVGSTLTQIAPVSGSVKQAQEGQLVVMVGGSAAAYEKAVSVIQPLSKLILHLGDIGAGNTVQSSFIADFDVNYTGRGPESSYTNQGWLGRVMNKVWPY